MSFMSYAESGRDLLIGTYRPMVHGFRAKVNLFFIVVKERSDDALYVLGLAKLHLLHDRAGFPAHQDDALHTRHECSRHYPFLHRAHVRMDPDTLVLQVFVHLISISRKYTVLIHFHTWAN